MDTAREHERSAADEADRAVRPSLTEYRQTLAARMESPRKEAYREWRERQAPPRREAPRGDTSPRLVDLKAAVRDEFRLRQRADAAMPPWFQPSSVLPMFVEARQLATRTGIRHRVEHVVPIDGSDCCGLHVPWNLRIVPEDGASGGRRPSPDVP